MQLTKSALIIQSFTWSFGTTKGFDSGNTGSYNTPIYLKAGDNIVIINTCVLSNLQSVTGNAAMQITDSTGSALNNNGPIIGGSLPAPPAFNFPLQAATTQNTVLNAGYMKLVIAVEAYTSGIVRFDFGIIRPF